MKESLREKVAARALSLIVIACTLYGVHECVTLILHIDTQQKLSTVLYGRCLDGDMLSCRDCAVNCFQRSQRLDSAFRAEPRQGRPGDQ